MPKSNKNKNKNRNMRKNRSLKRKINKNKSMRNKRKTNKRRMKGGASAEKTRVSKILKRKQGNIFLEGDNGEFNRFNKKTLIDRPTRLINRLARQRGYTPNHRVTKNGRFRFPLQQLQEHQQHHHQKKPKPKPWLKSKVIQPRQEEQLKLRHQQQLQEHHQHYHHQLQQQPHHQYHHHLTSSGKIKPWLLNPNQKTHQRQRSTPNTYNQSRNETQGDLSRRAMRRAHRMSQKGYSYVTAPTIHPELKKAFNRTHGHKRGPPPRGFIQSSIHR